MAAIHLYAEHLVNIRMLSIQASLQTTSNQETRSTLSADGKTLSLEHEGETAKVQFPAELLSGKNRATFVIPAAPTKDLTLRLRIDEKPGTTSVLGGDVVDNEIITPWTAASLTKGVEITCRSCCAVFVDRSTITQWKDLPSEGWAEMMEFWHCHKPDVPHETHDHGDIKKGYSADSHLVHDSGTCLVNPMEFWLAAKDCQNIEYDLPSSNGNTSVRCSQCKVLIGMLDPQPQGYRLRKPYLALTVPGTETATMYPTEKWLSCLLLSAIESQGVRKFVVHAQPASGVALKIWIFTPDLNVSSSAAREPEQPIRVAKVLWNDCPTPPTGAERMNGQTLSEGEIELPNQEVDKLRSCLEASAVWLPQGARIFQSWNVGLLKRFTRVDVEPA